MINFLSSALKSINTKIKWFFLKALPAPRGGSDGFGRRGGGRLNVAHQQSQSKIHLGETNDSSSQCPLCLKKPNTLPLPSCKYYKYFNTINQGQLLILNQHSLTLQWLNENWRPQLSNGLPAERSDPVQVTAPFAPTTGKWRHRKKMKCEGITCLRQT